jgi:hypothetical protein
MDQIPPKLGDGYNYEPLADFPGVYFCFDRKDPIHDPNDDREQKTLYLFIDKVDEAVIGITYDDTIELYCVGLVKSDIVNKIMTKILGGLRFHWVE